MVRASGGFKEGFKAAGLTIICVITIISISLLVSDLSLSLYNLHHTSIMFPFWLPRNRLRIVIRSVTNSAHNGLCRNLGTESHLHSCSHVQSCSDLSRPAISFSSYSSSFGRVSDFRARGYASVALAEAQAVVVSESSSSSSSPPPPKKPPKKEKSSLEMLRERQMKMESEAWEDAAEEYREHIKDMCEKKLAPNLPYVKKLLVGWFQSFRDAIAAEGRQSPPTPLFARYINLLPPDKIAALAMHKLMALLMVNYGTTQGVLLVKAAVHIGEAFEKEVLIQRCLESIKKKRTKTKKDDHLDPLITEQEKLKSTETDNLRKKFSRFMKEQELHRAWKMLKAYDDDSESWGVEAYVKIGCHLIQLLIKTAHVQSPHDQLGDFLPDTRPAFVHSIQFDAKTGKRIGVIECDPLVHRGLEKTARHVVIPYMPMLVPPSNWTKCDKGAYLLLPSYIIRMGNGAKRQREAVKRIPQKQLEHVFEALNTLGNTKWRVNKKVLHVIDRIWSGGGSLTGMVNREDVILPKKPNTEDKSEIRKWKRELRAAERENHERQSQRCGIELQLAVAHKMKDEEGFYYPHNIDFRGRAYPMHPYLNHLGSDICRGILEFFEGRPLGKNGLRWLKIHLANVYGGGVDKLSHDARVAFTENHLDDIFDSADSPLEGHRWWLEAEDPFQCLATCINISEALRSPSPETTLSHMPVHQDGSCNGLQHYAALGRDKVGGAAVNLVAGEKPADVYSAIAARVLDVIRKDANDSPTMNQHTLNARSLINQVDRKLVKQTVMTSVYGVTYVGARDQIKRVLKERGAIADDDIYVAACYAAKTTLKALEDMFTSARGIMSWLGNCAKVLTSKNHVVRWTSPIGLPVFQPYFQTESSEVYTSLQRVKLQFQTDKVMAKQQRTAFPPNFIHSLDASHMMMTAIACRKAGLNFAGVHDSYWTHACDVNEMNKILREKFVELYEASVLENLLDSFEKSSPTLKFPPVPDRGDLDIKEVLESPYFFN